MYNEIMNRPMFQTPQMREGGGIMAGVAPIRGYADGDLVEEDDSMIASLLSQAELPEFLSNLTMDDAVSYVKQNPEILIYGLPGVGIGGAAALKFGPGLARGATSLARRLLAKRKAPKATEADIMGNVPARKAPKGLSAEQQAEGIMGLPTKAAGAAKKVDAPETQGGIKSLGQRAATGIGGALRKGVGIGALAGGAGYLLQMPIVQDLINQGFGIDELMEMPEIRALLGTDMDEYAEKSRDELFTDATREGLRQITGQDPLTAPDDKEAMAKLREEALASEQPKAPPPPPPDPTFLDMLQGLGERTLESFKDPSVQYALAKTAQPSAGFVPRNPLSDFVLGKEEYRQLEAQRENDTALMRNYQFLKETTDLSDKEIISRLSGEATARDEFMSLFSEAVDTGGSVTPDQIAQFEAATGYTLPEEARVRLGIAAAPSDDVD